MLVKRLIFFIVIFGIISVLFTGCPPTPSPTAPTAITGTNPSNGATNVPLNKVLSWSGGDGATSYEVYFGTNTNPPKVDEVTTKSYNPGQLATGTTYHWKIIAKNSIGNTSSGNKTFETAFAVDIRGTWVIRETTPDMNRPTFLPFNINTQDLITGEAEGFIFDADDPQTQLGIANAKTDTLGNVNLATSAFIFVFWENIGTVNGNVMTGNVTKSFLLDPATYNGTFRAEKMGAVSFPNLVDTWAVAYTSGPLSGGGNIEITDVDGYGNVVITGDKEGSVAPSGFSDSSYYMFYDLGNPSLDITFTGTINSNNNITGTYERNGQTGNFTMNRIL